MAIRTYALMSQKFWNSPTDYLLNAYEDAEEEDPSVTYYCPTLEIIASCLIKDSLNNNKGRGFKLTSDKQIKEGAFIEGSNRDKSNDGHMVMNRPLAAQEWDTLATILEKRLNEDPKTLLKFEEKPYIH